MQLFLQSPTKQFYEIDIDQELPLGIRNPLWGWYREGKSIVNLIKLSYCLPAYEIVKPAYYNCFYIIIVFIL